MCYKTFKTFPKTLKLNTALADHTMIWHQKQRWGLKVESLYLIPAKMMQLFVCLLKCLDQLKKIIKELMHISMYNYCNVEKKIICKINLNLAPWNFAFLSYSKEPVPFIIVKLIINVSSIIQLIMTMIDTDFELCWLYVHTVYQDTWWVSNE